MQVRILGLVGTTVLHWNGAVRLRAPFTVRRVLAAAGRDAGADLLGAIAGGMQPTLLLDGARLRLPEELERTVNEGAELSWLMPMAGG